MYVSEQHIVCVISSHVTYSGLCNGTDCLVTKKDELTRIGAERAFWGRHDRSHCIATECKGEVSPEV